MPTPDGLKGDDERILCSFLAATESKGKVPCEHLGLDLGSGRFEHDPASWPAGSFPRGWRTRVVVTLEWKYVARGDLKAPHRVRVRADNAMLQGLPQDPLAQSGPKSLWFSVEFMEAYAEQRWPGTVYTGISYETADGKNRWVCLHTGICCHNSSSTGAIAPTLSSLCQTEATRSRTRPCTGRYLAGDRFA